MTEEIMFCQYCNEEISTREIIDGREPDILDWNNNANFYTHKVCKNCAVQHLEKTLKQEFRLEGLLQQLCKKRKLEIERLQKELESYRKFFKKQKARFNAFEEI